MLVQAFIGFINVRRIPPLGGVAIDLHLLYVEVTNRGGLEKVLSVRVFLWVGHDLCSCSMFSK
jgi:hypothetical protein